MDKYELLKKWEEVKEQTKTALNTNKHLLNSAQIADTNNLISIIDNFITDIKDLKE